MFEYDIDFDAHVASLTKAEVKDMESNINTIINSNLAKQIFKGYKSKRLSNYQRLDDLLTGKETNAELLQFFNQNITLCIEKCADNIYESVIKGFPTYYSLKINRGKPKGFIFYQDETQEYHIECLDRTENAFKTMIKDAGNWHYFDYLTMLSIYGIDLELANPDDKDLCLWISDELNSGWFSEAHDTTYDIDKVKIFKNYEAAKIYGEMTTRQYYYNDNFKTFYICKSSSLLNFKTIIDNI